MPRQVAKEQSASRRQKITKVAKKLGYRGTDAFEKDGSMKKSYKQFLIRNAKASKTPNFTDKNIKIPQHNNTHNPNR